MRAILEHRGWDAIRNDRFSLTPRALYDELVRSTEQIIPRWGGDYQRRQARLKAPLAQDEEGQAEAEKQVPSLEQTWRRKDKYGLVRALVPHCVCMPVYGEAQLFVLRLALSRNHRGSG